VTVTRTEAASFGQKSLFEPAFCPSSSEGQALAGGEVFCDWLSMYQDHLDGGLPVLNDGYVVRFGSDSFSTAVDPMTGELRPVFDAAAAEYTLCRRIEHEGSFDTRLSVRCDGVRVELSGNVGRFGRRDNLFGLPVLETIDRANTILSALGLPPFTHHLRSVGHARDEGFHRSHNAVITRVDLTGNYAAGDRESAYRVLHWMSGQGMARNSGKNPRNYGNGVTWNEGSKRHYEKLYFKADELGKYCDPLVAEYCESNGVLRYEVSLKSRELADRNLQNMVSWSRVDNRGLRMDNVIYGEFAEVLSRNHVSVMEVRDIPGKIGLIARSYINGENPYETQPAAVRTRRRWRAQLLPYGLDIAQPCDVMRLSTRIRVIELQPLRAPSWYDRAAA